MNQNYIFSSERLGFRVFTEEDTDTMFRISSDIEVMRFFPKVYDYAAAEQFIKTMKERDAEYGYSFYAVDYMEDKRCIGFIGLSYFNKPAEFSPCTEIGWRLDKAYWNKGLATEGALRCLRHASEDLDLKEIYAFTPHINLPSERVMQKIGMKKKGHFIHPLVDEDSSLNPHLFYHIEL